jgi:predicted phosphodiesterase
VAGKQSHEYPSDEELLEAVEARGCVAVAAELGLATSTLRAHLLRRGLPTAKRPSSSPSPGLRTLTLEADQLPESEWTPERLLAAHGLKADEWRVVRCRANRWGDEDDLKIQLRIDVEPVAPPFKFPDPAEWKPLPKPKKRKKQKVRTAAIIGDHHAPHHDKTFHRLFCEWLADEQPDQVIVNGDLLDAATLSRHRLIPEGGYDNPINECLQAAYGILRDYREACDAEVSIQRGNHDERLEHALIDNLTALYRVRAANDEVPALSLQRLLRLDELGVTYHDEQPWDRSKITVLDNHRLAARHGLSTTRNATKKALTDLGGSTALGHSHRLSVEYRTTWHPESGAETRLAAEAGCACEIEDGLGYISGGQPDWQQGFLIAKSHLPSDDFTVATAIYLPGRLLLPDGRRYSDD